MKKSSVLVTGGCGFIGSQIVDLLVSKNYKVRVLDNLDPQVHTSGKMPPWINSGAEYIQGDVRDARALENALKSIDAVIHDAAAVGVGQSQYQIKHYSDVNIGGTANLLDLIVNKFRDKIRKIIVASSMSCYGEGSYLCPKCGPTLAELRTSEAMQSGKWEVPCPKCKAWLKSIGTPESKPFECNSIYAITKKVQEEMVLNIGQTYKIPAVALRYFNVYGPRQSLSNPYTGVAAIFLSRLKNNNPPVIYEDGLQTRDFISVHDIAKANLLALENSGGDYQSFNVGTGKAISVLEIAQKLAKLLGKNIQPDITKKFRSGDIRHCVSDIGKIRKTFGFRPEWDFERGMKELMEWSQSQTAEDKFETVTKELRSKGLL